MRIWKWLLPIAVAGMSLVGCSKVYYARPDTLTLELPLVGGPKMVWKFEELKTKVESGDEGEIDNGD